MKICRNFFLLLISFFLLTQKVNSQGVSVRVQGEGDSFYAAQIEASRRAMMLVLPQLVSVDRLTINQDITNTILSSITGYIEKFDLIRETRNGNQVIIDANITISTESIRQFNSLLKPDGGMSISGSSIMAEYNRAETQSKFLNDYLARSFRGIPNSAIDFKIFKLERDPNSTTRLNIYVEGRFRPDFLDSLSSTLSAINCSAVRESKNCNLLFVVNKHSIGKTFFGQDKDSWDTKQINLSGNPPNSYEMLRLILRSNDRRNYYTVQWRFIGRVLFKDSLNQYIKDPIDTRTFAGLEFEFGLPINFCPTANSNSNCVFISGKPFIVKIPFEPKSFGDSFNKVTSMEISSYVERNFDSLYRRGATGKTYNIICDDLNEYLKIHYRDDRDLVNDNSAIPEGCKRGYYHDSERRIRNITQY